MSAPPPAPGAPPNPTRQPVPAGTAASVKPPADPATNPANPPTANLPSTANQPSTANPLPANSPTATPGSQAPLGASVQLTAANPAANPPVNPPTAVNPPAVNPPTAALPTTAAPRVLDPTQAPAQPAFVGPFWHRPPVLNPHPDAELDRLLGGTLLDAVFRWEFPPHPENPPPALPSPLVLPDDIPPPWATRNTPPAHIPSRPPGPAPRPPAPLPRYRPLPDPPGFPPVAPSPFYFPPSVIPTELPYPPHMTGFAGPSDADYGRAPVPEGWQHEQHLVRGATIGNPGKLPESRAPVPPQPARAPHPTLLLLEKKLQHEDRRLQYKERLQQQMNDLLRDRNKRLDSKMRDTQRLRVPNSPKLERLLERVLNEPVPSRPTLARRPPINTGEGNRDAECPGCSADERASPNPPPAPRAAPEPGPAPRVPAARAADPNAPSKVRAKSNAEAHSPLAALMTKHLGMMSSQMAVIQSQLNRAPLTGTNPPADAVNPAGRATAPARGHGPPDPAPFGPDLLKQPESVTASDRSVASVRALDRVAGHVRMLQDHIAELEARLLRRGEGPEAHGWTRYGEILRRELDAMERMDSARERARQAEQDMLVAERRRLEAETDADQVQQEVLKKLLRLRELGETLDRLQEQVDQVVTLVEDSRMGAAAASEAWSETGTVVEQTGGGGEGAQSQAELNRGGARQDAGQDGAGAVRGQDQGRGEGQTSKGPPPQA